MDGILTNLMWPIIGTIIALVAIFISIILFYFGKKTKRLSYDIVSNNPILLKKEDIKGKLEIFFNGKSVEDVYLIVIKLINSGNVPIETDDYEKPIVINFGKNAQILTVEVTETDPSGISVPIHTHKNKFEINPVLLNKSDSINFKILVSKFSNSDITFDGRIVGVKEIRKMTENKAFFIVLASGMSVMLFGAVYTSIVRTVNKDFFYASFFIGYIMILLGLITNKKFKRTLRIFMEVFFRK